MNTHVLDWRSELREILFTRDAHHRLWQLAFFAVLMIPPMLVLHRTAAEFLVGGIDVLFLLNSVSKKEWGWLRDPFFMILTAAWAWMVLVVTPFAQDIAASASIALPWGRFILFFTAMRYWVLTEARSFKVLASWMAVLLILIVVDTIWQYVFGVSLSNHYMENSGRLTGPFSNVKVGIYLSRMILPTIGLCLYFSFDETRKKTAIITYILLFCLVLVTIAISGERAPFGTAAAGVITALCVIAFKEQKARLASLVMIAVIISMVYMLISTQAWVYGRLLYTLDLLMDFRYTSYGQLFWMAWDMGEKHLLTGVGMRNFRILAEIYVSNGLADHYNLHPHHPYLEWFAEAGLIGLSLFVCFAGMLFAKVFSVLRHTHGRESLIAAFALGTLMVLFFPLVPTQSFFANWPAIVFWFPLSVAIASLQQCKRETS